MITATITAKGQVTIPSYVRKALNLKSRDQVIFIVEGERAILIPARRRSIMELRGSLPATAPFPGHQEIREEVRRQRGQKLALETCR
ncbi:MAG: AbrB/MazE/SpoVT family DNA-binding domain-containing protein [Anaerolineae bacterium]|nr:AbrB/MazE/SpoVT family DNA-binding domain-containing protein [Anaerolineae bacterium]